MKMHKIERNVPPKELKKKSNEWNKKLSKNPEVDINKEWRNFKSTKLGGDTLKNLKEMYSDCCMYCEGDVGVTSYGQIEHFKPKSKYPELCFDYDNLHLACEICNKNKGDKYEECYIDPTLVDPKEYIYYRNWEALGKNKVGDTMIELVQLNNDTRIKFRKERVLRIQERLNIAINYLEKAKENEEIKTIIFSSLDDIYKAMSHGSPYCTMIRDNFKENIDLIYKLLEIDRHI